VDLTRRLIAVATLLLAVTTSVAAQGIIVPAVAPTRGDDSLYKLVVDPATHEGEGTHLLFDSTSVSVREDGGVIRTFRRVIQVLTEAGAATLREQQFTYSPGHQTFVVKWLRVVRPDGSVVSAAPTHVQESDVPAPISTSPVYSDNKVTRVSLSGVTPGTILDVAFAVDEHAPAMKGDFAQTYVFTPGPSIERARFTLEVPSSLLPRIREDNLDFKHVTRTYNGRTRYIWSRDRTPTVKRELFAADSNGVIMDVRVGGAITWTDVSRWYAGLARDRYSTTPGLSRVVDSLVAGAKSREDSIRAVHRWVAQDIRYVGIELGIGGYQPRMPDTVIATGYGDCKDKATLFVAALGHLGIRAFPVLLSINASAKRDMPTPQQFNHEIAAVALAGGGYRFVDLTSSFSAYGELPLNIEGGFGIIVFPDGRNEEVTIPVDAPSSNVQSTRLTGELTTGGKFNGYYDEEATGALAAGMRAAFASPPDSAQRATAARLVARKYFTSGEGDSLVGFNGRDYAVPAHVRLRIRDANATTSAGPVVLLNNPFAGLTSIAAAADDIAALPTRRFPIDASKMIGLRTEITEFRVTLPDGWHARLPSDLTARSVFGSYTATYSQQGRELVLRHELVGTGGIFLPSRVNELVGWLRSIGSDNVKLIVLDPPPG